MLKVPNTYGMIKMVILVIHGIQLYLAPKLDGQQPIQGKIVI